jgi:phosphoglycolate phosphatase
MKKLVIFDLDGTLLNTIADLGNATNYAMNLLGYPTYDIPSYRFRVGNGINKLFERALPEGEKTEENVLRVRKLFLEYYDVHFTDETLPYAGIPELLHSLQQKNILLAVASNKYHRAATKLIQYFFGDIRFVAVYGQRDNIKTKPDPAVVYEITKLTNVNADEVLYAGDSGVDMQTALNAKVTSCGVTWGFRPRTELEMYHPDYIVNKPTEILPLIK